MNNEIDSAKYYYENIIAEKPNYTLNYLTKTRLSLLNIDELKNYLDGNDSTKYKILLKLNSIEYLYSSIPILLNLIGELKVDYTSSLKIFNKVFLVHDIESSYAAYRLSQFMLENKDYINARKYSALSLRYYNKNPFNFAMNNFFRKTNWFYKYANEVNNKFISTIVE
jgi:hypothetical protein